MYISPGLGTRRSRRDITWNLARLDGGYCCSHQLNGVANIPTAPYMLDGLKEELSRLPYSPFQFTMNGDRCIGTSLIHTRFHGQYSVPCKRKATRVIPCHHHSIHLRQPQKDTCESSLFKNEILITSSCWEKKLLMATTCRNNMLYVISPHAIELNK